jgi:hypothetical protein
MKNIILGIMGCMIAVYTIVSCLSIYSISARKNEMENCVAQVLEQILKRYYGKENGSEEAKAQVKEELLEQLHSSSRVVIDVAACDMQTGILSVSVQETFTLPGGQEKTISCDKTIIVEDERGDNNEKETSNPADPAADSTRVCGLCGDGTVARQVGQPTGKPDLCAGG